MSRFDNQQFFDQWSAIINRMLTNAGWVAANAAEQIDAGRFDSAAGLRTVTRMFDVAFLGAIEMVETTLSGPASPAPTRVWSDPIAVVWQSRNDRQLSISQPFTRLGTDEEIPSTSLSFEPCAGRDDTGSPLGAMPPGMRSFRIVAEACDLPSGLYQGMVRVASGGDESSEELVATLIAL